MEFSNSEKQARYRKKESLKRYANEIFQRTPFGLMGWWRLEDFDDIRTAINKAVDLPSGWTDEDYQRAINKLKEISAERFENPHLLENDVYDGRNSHEEFITTPDPAKLFKEDKEAIAKTRELATHILSALRLSGCGTAEQAAAMMEVIRSLGRSLNYSHKLYKSKAITMCLASIGPQYERPEWFAKSLTETLAENLGKKLTQKIGRLMCEYSFEL